jgi:hypothetical protein
MRRRRRIHWRRLARHGITALALALIALAPACSCGDPAGRSCEVDQDCEGACADGEVGVCINQTCVCTGDVPYGRIGQYSSMDVDRSGVVWVSGYASLHGDLVVASSSSPGRIPDSAWQFIDGVPDGPVAVPDSSVRGGILDPGPDVGLHTDIAIAPDDVVMVSYFDRDGTSLKFASNRGGSWSHHVVSGGVASGPDGEYAIVGQYSAITVAPDGRPGIAYFTQLGEGNQRWTELRFAQAAMANPGQQGDWTVTVVDSAPVPDGAGSDSLPIPMGVGLFADATRLSDGSPVLVYYDRIGGALKSARMSEGEFGEPEVLDGGGVDVGWYPGVTVDSGDELHVSYVSAANDDLLYVNTIDRLPEVVDDGYRLVGTTEDGLPVPEFHFVGDDSSVVLTSFGPHIAYQDATSHELRVAWRTGAGVWNHRAVAGDEAPFAGGYGFYTAAKAFDNELAISTWVVDQPSSEAWVEIFFEADTVE